MSTATHYTHQVIPAQTCTSSGLTATDVDGCYVRPPIGAKTFEAGLAIGTDECTSRMEVPDGTKIESSTLASVAPLITTGGLPLKLDTVTSEVLARLLNGERLTSLDTVYVASTTRLSAVVFYLESTYHWTIKRSDKAVGTRDGRGTWITEYWIDSETAASSFTKEADSWSKKVREARSARRAKAALALKWAERANDAVRRRTHSRPAGQFCLFDGGDRV